MLFVFPVSNVATLGYKLQGNTFDEVVVAESSGVGYGLYVFFSRVKSINHLTVFPTLFHDSCVTIVDEISFMNYRDLSKMSKRIEQSMIEYAESKHSKDAIVCLGDFYQLDCVGGVWFYPKANPTCCGKILATMIHFTMKFFLRCDSVVQFIVWEEQERNMLHGHFIGF